LKISSLAGLARGLRRANPGYRSFQHDLPDMLDTLKIKRHEMTFVDFRRAVKRWLVARTRI
jgi:hypothetical protein